MVTPTSALHDLICKGGRQNAWQAKYLCPLKRIEMVSTISTTTWRYSPVIPDNYDDLRELVRLARKARRGVVAFDWLFTESELRELRPAIFAWGRPSRGRYKAFDARVLNALNLALSEPLSYYRLDEPAQADMSAVTVACVQADGGHRLQGTAPFDVVLGYCQQGLQPHPDVDIHLGEPLRKRLVQLLTPLGWDLERLLVLPQVVAALYSCAQPPSGVVAEQEPSRNLDLRFHGPFTLTEQPGHRCLFTDELAAQKGIYIWTLPIEGKEVPWYIGQTVSFGLRTAQHMRDHLAGAYETFDADALEIGQIEVLWPPSQGSERWPTNLPVFLQQFDVLGPHILRMFDLLRIHVAPVDGGKTLLDRLEGGIGRQLKRGARGAGGLPVLAGVKLPAAIAGEARARVRVTSESAIEGLPEEIVA